jgi:hypothetical protein
MFQQVLEFVQAALEAAGINGTFIQAPPVAVVRSSSIGAPPPKANSGQAGLTVQGKLGDMMKTGRSMHQWQQRYVCSVCWFEPTTDNSVQHMMT